MGASRGTVTGVMLVFFKHLKIEQCHLTFLSSFSYSTFSSVFGMLTFLSYDELGKDLQHLFIENCQVQTYIIITLLFVGEEFFPFCCHFKIGFTFP